MERRPIPTRNLPVRDVSNEQVEERVLRIVADRRPSASLDETLPLKRVQGLGDNLTRAAVDETANREDLSVNGRLLQQALLLGSEPVEPRGDDSLDGFG